jgi:hypothetical protein
MSEQPWTLNPSDFTALWDECPRCFYLHVARRFPRPISTPVELDARLKAACDGQRTETITADMPPGVFEVGERQIESRMLDVHLPDAIHRCLIRGTIDILVRLDDGSFAVVDLVTGATQLRAHERRLRACAYALEHAAPGAPALGPVSRAGLLVFEPEKFAADTGGVGVLSGGLTWRGIPRDDARLFGFLAEALAVLAAPEPPGGTPLCRWCVYRDASRRTGL